MADPSHGDGTSGAGGSKPALRCGIYKTTVSLGNVPVGKLVYFHNHGDPGPGVYLPRAWAANRAEFHEKGHTISMSEARASLASLASEGLYCVEAPFWCCEKKCREFATHSLVQLGYNAEAAPILFTPAWTPTGLSMPGDGTRVNTDVLVNLRELIVANDRRERGVRDSPTRGVVH